MMGLQERVYRKIEVKVKLRSQFSITSALAVASAVVGVACANAGPKAIRSDGSIYSYEADGPAISYQEGPHTSIFATKRSWLDGGTEVVRGERKFDDYAFTPGYSFVRENNNRPADRRRLDPSSDTDGFLMSIPLD